MSLYVCACACVHVCVWVSVFLCVWMHECMRVSICVHVGLRVCMRACLCVVCVCVCACISVFLDFHCGSQLCEKKNTYTGKYVNKNDPMFQFHIHAPFTSMSPPPPPPGSTRPNDRPRAHKNNWINALTRHSCSASPSSDWGFVSATLLMDGQKEDATHSTIWLMPPSSAYELL